MTIKQSNIDLSTTHFNEGCQAPLFRFKDECGKEESLVEMNERDYNLYFNPKDFIPSCILIGGDSCSLYIYSSSAGFNPAPASAANLFKTLLSIPGKRSFIDLNLVGTIGAGFSGINSVINQLFSHRNL